MNALDSARSFYTYLKAGLTSGTSMKFILESATEEASAIMASNSVCLSVGDDIRTFESTSLGRKRDLKVGIHILNADAVIAIGQMQVLTKLLTENNSASYYDYTIPAGTLVLGYKVGWDTSQVQFSHVEHDFRVSYWMCEINLHYYY